MEADDNDLAALRRAVLDDPRNGERRYLLGAELAQRRDYEGAVLEMSAALALNPFLHVARLQLGLLHLTMAQPHHATAVLGPLEELADDSALKQFKRGLEALMQDDFAVCLGALQQGIASNRDNAALNRDMQLIVDRIEPLVQAGDQADSSAVRTDFSLYGLTKH
jgi:tetratricopeptide (TPR) repeat protein